MAERKVLMHVGTNGDVKIEAQGYVGGECLTATGPFEAMFAQEKVARVAVGECGPSPDMGERVNYG
jgi:hypothetical protein